MVWIGGFGRVVRSHALTVALTVLCVVLFSGANAAQARGCPPLLDHTFPDLITGKPVPMCQFQGKVVLVVNTASKCSYTPQYEQLEAVSRKFAPKGLTVVGFPSNDFGQQERGSSTEIAEFCKLNYGVSFPMFERSEVKGRNANALHAQLARRTGVAPGWNFHKYLIDRNGVKVVSFESEVAPDDPKILREIERMLAEPVK